MIFWTSAIAEVFVLRLRGSREKKCLAKGAKAQSSHFVFKAAKGEYIGFGTRRCH